MTYQLTTLDNGLRIATETLPHMETVALAISVDVGARWESLSQHGVSHLLEHMAFKGTATRSALDIAEAFDAIGGHSNAYTSHEHTVYYAKVLKEHWPKASDILCDILQQSVYDETELEREKQVILQELAMHQDTPDDLVFDHFQEAAFGAQALGRSILGTTESITAHPRQDIVEFVAQHYAPSRMVVTATGAIDHDELVADIASRLHWQREVPPVRMEHAHYIGGERIVRDDLEQLQLLLGIGSIPFTDARYYALQLFSIMLGGGMSSRLFQEVREKRGLVYTIQSLNASYADCGTFSIYAATSEKDAPEVIALTCDELLRATHTFSHDELNRAKQQQIANLRMARESTASLAEWIGRHLLQFGEYRHAYDLQQRVEAVTLDDVHTLAKDLLKNPTVSLAALGPVGSVMSAEKITQRLAA